MAMKHTPSSEAPQSKTRMVCASCSVPAALASRSKRARAPGLRRLAIEDLDRHVALRFLVAGHPHLARAAGADAQLQAITAQPARLEHLPARGPHLVGGQAADQRRGEHEQVVVDELGQRGARSPLRRHVRIERRRDPHRQREQERRRQRDQEAALPAIGHERRLPDHADRDALHIGRVEAAVAQPHHRDHQRASANGDEAGQHQPPVGHLGASGEHETGRDEQGADHAQHGEPIDRRADADEVADVDVEREKAEPDQDAVHQRAGEGDAPLFQVLLLRRRPTSHEAIVSRPANRLFGATPGWCRAWSPAAARCLF
jgi:hypothetical protein